MSNSTRSAPSRTFALRKLRVDSNLTQQQLAAKLGLPLDRYRRLENNEQQEWLNQGVYILLRAASFFGVPPTELYPRLGEVPAGED